VGEVFQNLEPLLHDPVALAAEHIHDEADAARVVFVGWIVEALGGREAGARGLVCHGRTFSHKSPSRE
jgi:hypothetical protein